MESKSIYKIEVTSNIKDAMDIFKEAEEALSRANTLLNELAQIELKAEIATKPLE